MRRLEYEAAFRAAEAPLLQDLARAGVGDGQNRGLLLDASRRSRRPEAMTALESLRDDPELSREVAVILRRKGRSRGRESRH